MKWMDNDVNSQYILRRKRWRILFPASILFIMMITALVFYLLDPNRDIRIFIPAVLVGIWGASIQYYIQNYNVNRIVKRIGLSKESITLDYHRKERLILPFKNIVKVDTLDNWKDVYFIQCRHPTPSLFKKVFNQGMEYVVVTNNIAYQIQKVLAVNGISSND